MDWLSWFINAITNLVIGFLGFLIGMWAFNKYFLPKMAPSMAKDTIKAVQEMPEIKDLLKRAKTMLDKVEPLIEQLKKLDLGKLDVDKINEVIATAKDLAENLKGLVGNKPKDIPKPD